MNKSPMKEHLLILFAAFIILIWSYINSYGRFEWIALAVPAMLYMIVLASIYKKFRFTTFTYIVVLVHILILLIGAKYTYTLNPFFDFLKELFNLSRNHYDRVGHFAQGFVPVFITKEVILRKGYMKRSKFFYLVVYCFVLAISAFYELVEFAMVTMSGRSATFILGHQGDIWDTQWDMILALIGATCALLVFSRYHDKKMMEIDEE